MTKANSNPAISQQANSRRHVLVLIGIFVSGCIVGGAITRGVSRYQWRMALKNPDSLATRIAPQIVSTVGLRAEQLNRVESLISKRYERMEALRAETYPHQVAEFDQLCSEIEEELDETQRIRWMRLVTALKNEYLPIPPFAPPTTDFLFRNFDANDDKILECSELPLPMWMRVRNADSDGDERVTRTEFETARSAVSP